MEMWLLLRCQFRSRFVNEQPEQTEEARINFSSCISGSFGIADANVNITKRKVDNGYSQEKESC